MEPSRSKRQRIMIVSHHVLSRPDLPAVFESLNDDTQGLILKLVGNKSYATYAGINKHCKEIYLTSGMKKETFVYGYAPLAVIIDNVVNDRNNVWDVRKGVGKGVVYHNRNDVLDWAIQEKNKKVLREICDIAAEEGRIDILNIVLSNVEDWDDKACSIFDIFGGSGSSAVYDGNLEVLKWLKTHRVHFNKSNCASEAARHGHVHILQWLEDQHLSLYGYGSLSCIRDEIVNDRNNVSDVGKGVVFYNRIDVLNWALKEKKNQVLRGICEVAGREGRIDIFNEIWSTVEDWDDKACIFEIFGSSGSLAAGHGNLEVLKWLKTHRVHFNRSICASTAARCGHLHILQWLKDQRLSLYVDLYDNAIGSDHLHVIKWLREQGCTPTPRNNRCSIGWGNSKTTAPSNKSSWGNPSSKNNDSSNNAGVSKGWNNANKNGLSNKSERGNSISNSQNNNGPQTTVQPSSPTTSPLDDCLSLSFSSNSRTFWGDNGP